MSEQIVVTEGLTKVFARDAGVFDLDLELPSGAIIGFIGPSGSGKTTTVRLMTGILRPDRGSVRVLGKDPAVFDARTRARIGYMPQEAILYPDLTLAENLDFAASLYGVRRGRRKEVERLIGVLELDGAAGRFPRQTSGGERRRLMLASTLIHDPELLFLDEPTAGIDPVLRKKVWDRFTEMAATGRSLVVTTQYVAEAAYCDHVAVLADGRVLAFDTPVGLRRRAYGGELVDVVFSSRPADDHLEALYVETRGRELAWLDWRSVRMVVDDAGEAGPAISRWSQRWGVDVRETEAHIPAFDEVFVELVEKLDGAPESRQPDDENEGMSVAG